VTVLARNIEQCRRTQASSTSTTWRASLRSDHHRAHPPRISAHADNQFQLYDTRLCARQGCHRRAAIMHTRQMWRQAWCRPDQPTSMDPSFPARPNPYLSGDWPPSVSSRPAFSRPLLNCPSLEARIRVLEGRENKTLSRKPLDLTVAGGRRRTGNWRARSIEKGPSTRTVRVWLGRTREGEENQKQSRPAD
jgi:hypothetical protein